MALLKLSWPVIGLALAALLLGLLGSPAQGWALLGLGLIVWTLRHLRRLSQMQDWLEGRCETLPADTGVWGDIFFRLQRTLQKSETKQAQVHADFEQMLHVAGALPEGVVILDLNQRIVWLNRAANQHLGLTMERDRGQFINYLLRDPRFNAWLTRADASEGFTLLAPGLPGHTLSLQQTTLPQDRRMLLSHDVTELIRLDEMRRDFIANVSHELRTPVTVIAGFLETFADMGTPDPALFRQHIARMLEQSERMRNLIDDLLALARLEAEPAASDERVDMAQLVERLKIEAESLSHGQHHFVVVISASEAIRGSGQEIYSACMNLVSNAVRYTPAGGTITLRWEVSPGTGAQFVVQDTGEGIEAQHLPRLTERFYRVDRGRSRANGGTGLGLAIVKRVLLHHQGRLKVDSQVGKGSVFAAVFPAERLMAQPNAAQSDSVNAA